ncbi:hypothetical protein N7457_000572 [Penicillium paradoxum]|uniref:uncharacterized protein n=1 Tax=Penicillium paradoxum TaxID=176176 RepID=UPI0025497707|nr:uncharacterized protein N7457_000572 [Penicillium paradoxum]KAJ5793973.1 hypothetical protein N7457_000572 [Penicillium paradoxum]
MANLRPSPLRPSHLLLLFLLFLLSVSGMNFWNLNLKIHVRGVEFEPEANLDAREITTSFAMSCQLPAKTDEPVREDNMNFNGVVSIDIHTITDEISMKFREPVSERQLPEHTVALSLFECHGHKMRCIFCFERPPAYTISSTKRQRLYNASTILTRASFTYLSHGALCTALSAHSSYSIDTIDAGITCYTAYMCRSKWPLVLQYYRSGS